MKLPDPKAAFTIPPADGEQRPPCALCERALGNVLGFKARWFCWRCFAQWQKDSFPPSYDQFRGDDAANFEAWFQGKKQEVAA